MVYLGGPVPRLDTAVRDAPHRTAFIDPEAQLEHFQTLFCRVKGAPLNPEQSRDLIRQLAKELRGAAMTTPVPWQKSSFSGGGEGNDCVELAATRTAAHFRESDTLTVQLITPPTALAHLVHGTKAGSFGTEVPSA